MHVFLSHSSSDEQFASELREQLAARAFDVWNPSVALMPGSNWALETGLALEQADGVIFLFSKDAAQSPWLRKEVEYTITQPKFEGKVVSVVLEPNLDIPWILHNLPVVSAVKRGAEQVAREVAQ